MSKFVKTVLGASAIALACGGAASAQSAYVKGFGGVTVPQNNDFNINARDGSGSAATGFDFSTGYTLGIAGGYNITPSIGVELEYAFRNADADFKGGGPSPTTESNAWMVNGIYNFTPTGMNGAWQPYVGAGLGAADLNVGSIDGYDGGDFDSDYNFAYQLIGGIKYNLPSGWTLNGEARFFGVNDQTIENDFYSFKTTYKTFDLLFGATYNF